MKKDACVIKISGKSVSAEVKKDLHKLNNLPQDACQLTLKFMLLVTLRAKICRKLRSFVDLLKGLPSSDAVEASKAILNVHQVLRGHDVENVITAVNNESILENVCEINAGIDKHLDDRVQSKFYQDFFGFYVENTCTLRLMKRKSFASKFPCTYVTSIHSMFAIDIAYRHNKARQVDIKNIMEFTL